MSTKFLRKMMSIATGIAIAAGWIVFLVELGVKDVSFGLILSSIPVVISIVWWLLKKEEIALNIINKSCI